MKEHKISERCERKKQGGKNTGKLRYGQKGLIDEKGSSGTVFAVLTYALTPNRIGRD